MTGLQAAEWGRKDTHLPLSFPYGVREVLFLPLSGDVREGEVQRKLQHKGEPPYICGECPDTRAGPGVQVSPLWGQPMSLTAWACSWSQCCFLPWCIQATSSNPRRESRDGAGSWFPFCSFSFLQRSQQLKRSAWLAPAPCRLSSGLPVNIGVLFVPQQEAWVVERMGKFHRILEPVRSRFSPLLDSASS